MTRFLYLTDTHVGGSATEGFMMQPRHPEYLQALHARLKTWVAANRIDFVIHGGDLVERGVGDLIEPAVAMIQSLGVPVYLCLGNHDLSEPDSIGLWYKHHDGLLPDGDTVYGFTTEDLAIFIASVHWNSLTPPHYWRAEDGLVPLLDDGQRDRLEQFCGHTGLPVALVLHNELNAVPASQTGLPEDIHLPKEPICSYVHGLAARFPNLKLVMGGHNHVNTASRQGSFVSMTTAAFGEAPFEARLVQVSARSIDVSTVRFADLLGKPMRYDNEKAWVQGNQPERNFRVPGDSRRRIAGDGER